MKRWGSVLLVFLFATILGAGFAYYKLKKVAVSSEYMISNGSWNVLPTMDLKDRYQRSFVAIAGLFALQEEEVLYYVAREDSEGRPLSAEYDYVLEGPSPAARYWSYTIYGADYHLIKNDLDRFGFNLDNIQYENVKEGASFDNETTSRWHQVLISSTPKNKNWLPSGDGDFYINLRLYQPAPEVYQHLGTATLPTITRLP